MLQALNLGDLIGLISILACGRFPGMLKFQLLIIGLILATLYLFNFLPQLLTQNTGLVPPDH